MTTNGGAARASYHDRNDDWPAIWRGRLSNWSRETSSPSPPPDAPPSSSKSKSREGCSRGGGTGNVYPQRRRRKMVSRQSGLSPDSSQSRRRRLTSSAQHAHERLRHGGVHDGGEHASPIPELQGSLRTLVAPPRLAALSRPFPSACRNPICLAQLCYRCDG